MDFSNWTIDDFRSFDAQRAKVAGEFYAQQKTLAEASNLESRTDFAKSALKKYGISFSGDEKDFSNLYREYISGSPDMKEWIGADLEAVIAERSAKWNDIKGFTDFVCLYES